MKRLLSLILIMLFVLGCTKQLLIKDYTNAQPAYSMYGQIPERSFYYPVELTDSLELVWNEDAKGSFSNNSVVVEGNYVFTSDLAANIYCFDIESGKTIGADKGKGETAISPILNNGMMYYIITQSDETYSLLIRYDIRKGERLKEIEIPGRVGNEIIKLENWIVFVTDDGTVYQYDIFLQETWKTELDRKVYTSPASNEKDLFVITYDGDLICLNLTDGSIKYETSLGSNFESSLVINNNVGFVGSTEGKLISFNLNDGSIKWEFETDAKIKSPITHNNEYGYIGNLAGSVYAFNLESGEIIWNYISEGMFNAPGALFKNVLLQPDVNEKLLFINPETGEVEKQIDFESRVKLHPVYFQNKLFVGVDRGELYCYKLVEK